MYYNLGEHKKALEFYTKSLEIRQQTLPENHPGIADSYYNIGVVYKRLKDYENALLSFTKAKEIYAICYGVEHPETVDCNKRIEDVKAKLQLANWWEKLKRLFRKQPGSKTNK